MGFFSKVKKKKFAASGRISDENLVVLKTKSDFEDYKVERDLDFNLEVIQDKQYLKQLTDEVGKQYEIKKGDRVFWGYASTIDLDRTDDEITIEALRKSKNDLLAPGARTVFYNHDTDMPIGFVFATKLDSKGLLVGVKISSAKDVEDIWTKIKEGTINSLSIRARYKKVELQKDEEGRVTSTKILAMELFEVSAVGLPMNAKCSIVDVFEKSFRGLSKLSSKSKNGKDTVKQVKKLKTRELKVMKKKAHKKGAKEIKSSKKTTKPDATPTNVISMKSVKKLVRKSVEKLISPVAKSVETMAATMGKFVETVSKTQEEQSKQITKLSKKHKVKKSKLKSAKEKTEVQNKQDAKIDGLQKLVKKALNRLSTQRKGVQIKESDEDDEEGNEEGSPSKVITDVNDPKCVAYAQKVCRDASAFKKLSEDERRQVGGIFIANLLRKEAQRISN